MTIVTAQGSTTKVAVRSHGKERLKRKAFKRPRKTGIECTCGRKIKGTHRKDVIKVKNRFL